MNRPSSLSHGYKSHCATATAKIRHRRFKPKPHEFNASLNYLWFDPDQIESICQQSKLWSFNRWNIFSLHEPDYLPNYAGSLRAKVQQHLAQHAAYDLKTDDQVRILALPRSFGYGFNSVIFYFVWADQHLRFIISEITNTPWGERHAYTHDCLTSSPLFRQSSTSYPFSFDKAFHVSPFMPMDIQYHWNFTFDSTAETERLFIEMRLLQKQKIMFDASMQVTFAHLNNAAAQTRYALMFPLQGVKMLGMIYLQAMKLWLKKIPFHPHPRNAD